MEYRVRERCFHDGIYFYEGDTANFPDGVELPEHFQPVGGPMKSEPQNREDSIQNAIKAEIKKEADKLKLGPSSLKQIYKKAGAESPAEQLAALQEYAKE